MASTAARLCTELQHLHSTAQRSPWGRGTVGRGNSRTPQAAVQHRAMLAGHTATKTMACSSRRAQSRDGDSQVWHVTSHPYDLRSYGAELLSPTG